MKALTTFLLALTTCTLAFAQPNMLPKIENYLSEGKSSLTVTDLFDFIEVDKTQFFEKKNIANGSVDFIRDHGNFQKMSFSTDWFDFVLLVDKGSEKILYSKVDLSGRKSISDENVFQQYHVSFEQHISNHEKTYNVKIDLADEDMSPINNFTFGTGCGWNGPLPEKGMKMFELVKNNDQKTLMTWAKSMNPSIQCYGIMGLHFMEKRGAKLKLKKKDRKVIELVKNKKTTIDYCSNTDLNASTSMNSVLNEFFLDSIYEVYKDSKYLR